MGSGAPYGRVTGLLQWIHKYHVCSLLQAICSLSSKFVLIVENQFPAQPAMPIRQLQTQFHGFAKSEIAAVTALEADFMHLSTSIL
jgi:hypothetical protein